MKAPNRARKAEDQWRKRGGGHKKWKQVNRGQRRRKHSEGDDRSKGSSRSSTRKYQGLQGGNSIGHKSDKDEEGRKCEEAMGLRSLRGERNMRNGKIGGKGIFTADKARMRNRENLLA
ncbi:hypothetical protein BT69DRAFT_1292911 [Atractiella rhizophila]|nr:hypothetical protein BT69DRAFT_1292911 [Atractiella rhizophila]